MTVLLGNGDGTFAAGQSYATGLVPKSVAIGDVNGNGTLDVVTADTAGNGDGVTGIPGGDRVSVLLGDGTGALGAATDFLVGQTPFSVYLADLNGDGKLDLSTAEWDSNTVTVRLNTTSGGAPSFVVNSVSPAQGASGVAAASNVTASFSADVNQSTLTASTVTLQQGANPPVAAVLSYSAATRTVTLDPSTDLQAGATYTATVVGGASGVKDTGGNTLAASKVWTFTVAPAGGTTSYLSDLSWTQSTNGWGPVEKDMSNGEQAAGDGHTITLNGVTYAKGLGVNAASDVRYAVSGCSSFQSDVGVDDEVGANGTVVFQVFLDGAQVYDSALMTATTATKSINLDLTGKSELRLVVTDSGDNNWFDHADWAGARITCGSGGGNQPPVPTISSPTSLTTFAVGDVINFQGSAVDPEDGNLPASGLSWQINIQHCVGVSCHIHYFMTVPGSGGSFTVPDHGDMFHFDLTLTATDSAGRSASTTVSIQPRTLQLTLATNPTGLQVVVGGTAATAPYTTTQVDRATVTIFAPSPQNALSFSSWSDGGVQQHNVTLGTTDATYTANFVASPSFTVTSVSPLDAATNVSAASNVTASFSADVNQSTLTASTVTLRQGANPPVAAALSYNAATRTVTLDPSTDLQAGATYTATVVGGASGVKDTGGNTLAASKVWTFTVAASASFTVTSVSPLDAATNVSASSNVTASFSADVNQSTLTASTVTLRQGANPPVAAALSYSAATRTVTLDPSTDLQAGATYTATVVGGASGVKDTGGNTLAASKVWTFTVAASASFTVTSVSPLDAATNVSASSNVTASFSADVNQSTLTASTVTLRQGANPPVAAALSYSAATRTVTLDPSTDLQAGATYTATVVGGASGVKDTGGNTLAASKVWTFTVAPAGGTTSYLSDLSWTQSTNGWGPVEKDMSNGGQAAGDGHTITLNGVTYAKGLGSYAPADIRYEVSGCSSFQSDVGVDDEVGTKGTVIFRVYLDGKKVYDSGKMTGSSATRNINLDLTAKSKLRLVVAQSGSNSDDSADWAGARVTCSS